MQKEDSPTIHPVSQIGWASFLSHVPRLHPNALAPLARFCPGRSQTRRVHE